MLEWLVPIPAGKRWQKFSTKQAGNKQLKRAKFNVSSLGTLRKLISSRLVKGGNNALCHFTVQKAE